MDEELERAIWILSQKITASVQPDFALKYTQAALNLAHVKTLLVEDRARGKKVAGS